MYCDEYKNKFTVLWFLVSSQLKSRQVVALYQHYDVMTLTYRKLLIYCYSYCTLIIAIISPHDKGHSIII